MPLTLADRFHPDLRCIQQEAIDAGQLGKLDEISLLEQQRLLTLPVLMLSQLLCSDEARKKGQIPHHPSWFNHAAALFCSASKKALSHIGCWQAGLVRHKNHLC
jgi:hypothetical protein